MNCLQSQGTGINTLAERIRHALRTDLRQLRELDDRLEEMIEAHQLNQRSAAIEQRLSALEQRLITLGSETAVSSLPTASITAQRLNALTAETGVQQRRVAKNIADINRKIAALTEQIAQITACTCVRDPYSCQPSLGGVERINTDGYGS